MTNNNVTLHTGAVMPITGFGTWQIPKDVCKETVYTALKNGYRHLDCACDYGNEVQVGEGIKKAIDEGILKREDLFVTSKLWNTYHAKENVRPAIQRTLDDMGLDYLDLYLIHFPISLKFVPFEKRYPPEWAHNPQAANPTWIFENTTIQETWKAMEELVPAGLTRHIGVANFNGALLQDLLKYATIKPAVNQVELHPYLQQPGLLKYMSSQDIKATGYSTFGGASYSWSELGATAPRPLDNSVITEIAKKHNRPVGQVILRFFTQQGVVVIPKSLKEERAKENLAHLDITLDEDDIKKIKALSNGLRFNDPMRYGPDDAPTPIFD
eukprot:TRINITY_DN1184_c0_g1_i1.p1 TRINITY_DN1184_c0_g1~~TRINITY_DN1184_c0_g1_i1.p1  ORF type:complete len:334 (+),score=93.70 TRINITY_DN1184_c0_g1_i1:25-1002(+)